MNPALSPINDHIVHWTNRNNPDYSLKLQTSLQTSGFVVVREAISIDLVDNLLAAISSEFGLTVDVPESWYELPSRANDIVPMWGHPAQWEIRIQPAIVETWRTIHKHDNLLISIDRCRFTAPFRDGRPDPLALHWDLNPYGLVDNYQGLVALTNSSGRTGFRCLPESLTNRSLWPAEATRGEGYDESWLVPELAIDRTQTTYVPLLAGDLLVWSSRLAHANAKNVGRQPRVVFYVLMNEHPTARERQSAYHSWKTGSCPENWQNWHNHDHRERWAPVPIDLKTMQRLGIRQGSTN